MIKKIYDRDTGNIYDVGADSKLKLVAEGTFVVDSSSYSDSVVVNINGNYEYNKLYLLELYHPANEWVGIAVIKLDCHSSIPFPDENEELSNLKVYFSKVMNNPSLTIEGTSTDIIYGDETYKIYELPFSM